MTTRTDELIDAIGAGFAGTLVTPSDSSFDTARAVWNGMIDARPGLIARCSTSSDVVACVVAASRTNCDLAVRGGGHQVAGFSVCDDGLVIDLSALSDVYVDPAQQRAVAGGGCLLRDLDRATQDHGLVCPAGVVSHTGLGGLALSGGIGWTSRMFGLTCDNVLGVEIVTADGAVRRAGPSENEDLYWAVRGGGGNFGVVTAFDLALHRLREVHLSALAFPFDDAFNVLTRQAELAAEAPDELTTATILRTAQGPFAVPGFASDRPLALVTLVHCGNLRDAERTLDRVRSWGASRVLRSGSTPYLELQTMGDELSAHGIRAYEKSGYVRRLDAVAIGDLLASVEHVPSAHTQVEVLFVGGAAARIAEDATAFPRRSDSICLNVVAMWRNATDDTVNVDWARACHRRMEPHLTGGYVNFVGDEQERVGSVFGPRKLNRLREVKTRYDPQNLFHRNLNIEPLTPVTRSGLAASRQAPA